MKLKQVPEDFQVEELTRRRPDRNGPFSLYLLRKRSIGTPEAVEVIRRAWKIDARRIGYGGLKDRHADTRQYLTIQNGPKRDLRLAQLTLRHVGQLQTPFSPSDIEANRFRLVLRDLGEDEARAMQMNLDEVRRDGVANYFDDQRFGSVSAQGGFVARKLIDGDYEAALRLALVEPYEFDRAPAKRQKRLLACRWGDWAGLLGDLGDLGNVGGVGDIVAHLAHRPGDFRGAFARLRADLKSLYLAAYQSHLWNRILSHWLERQLRPDQMLWVDLQLGRAVSARNLDADQRATLHAARLPLPSARLKPAADDPLRPLIDSVLAEDGLKLNEMKLKHFREPFFARGERSAFFVPANLCCRQEPDDRHTGREKLLLRFDLPRGAYATILVKRISHCE